MNVLSALLLLAPVAASKAADAGDALGSSRGETLREATLSAERRTGAAETVTSGRALLAMVEADPGDKLAERALNGLLTFAELAVRLDLAEITKVMPILERTVDRLRAAAKLPEHLAVRWAVLRAEQALRDGVLEVQKAMWATSAAGRKANFPKIFLGAVAEAEAALAVARQHGDETLVLAAQATRIQVAAWASYGQPDGVRRAIAAGKSLLSRIAAAIDGAAADRSTLGALYARVVAQTSGSMAPETVADEDHLAFLLAAQKMVASWSLQPGFGTARLQVQLATVAARLERKTLADVALRRYLAFWRGLPDYPLEQILGDAATLYLAIGDKDQAGRLLQEAFAIRAKRLGPDHPDLGAGLEHLLRWYGQNADVLFQIAVMEGVLADATSIAQANPSRRTISNRLAKAYETSGRQDEATALRRKVDQSTALPQKVRGLIAAAEKGEVGHDALEKAAFSYSLLDDESSAFGLYETATKLRIAALGLQGEKVQLNYALMAGYLVTIGRLADARQLLIGYAAKLQDLPEPDFDALFLALRMVARKFREWGDGARADYFDERARTAMADHELRMADNEWQAKTGPFDFPASLPAGIRQYGKIGKRKRVTDILAKYFRDVFSADGALSHRSTMLVRSYSDWLREYDDADIGRALQTQMEGVVGRLSLADLCLRLKATGAAALATVTCPAKLAAKEPAAAKPASPASGWAAEKQRLLGLPLTADQQAEVDRLARGKSFLPLMKLFGKANTAFLDDKIDIARRVLVAALDTLPGLTYRNAASEAETLDRLAITYDGERQAPIAIELRQDAVQRLLADKAYVDSALGEIMERLISGLVETDRLSDAEVLIAEIGAAVDGVPATEELRETLRVALAAARARSMQRDLAEAGARLAPEKTPAWASRVLASLPKDKAAKLLTKAQLETKLSSVVERYPDLEDRDLFAASLHKLFGEVEQLYGATHPITAMVGFQLAGWLSRDKSLKAAVPLLRQIKRSQSHSDWQSAADLSADKFAFLSIMPSFDFIAAFLMKFDAAEARLADVERQLAERRGAAPGLATPDGIAVLESAAEAYMAAFEYEKSADAIIEIVALRTDSAPMSDISLGADTDLQLGALSLVLSCHNHHILSLLSGSRSVQKDCVTAAARVMSAWIARTTETWRQHFDTADDGARQQIRETMSGNAMAFLSQLRQLMAVPQEHITGLITEGLALAELAKSNPTGEASLSFSLRDRLERESPGASDRLRAHRRAKQHWVALNRELVLATSGAEGQALSDAGLADLRRRVAVAKADADAAETAAAGLLARIRAEMLSFELDLDAVQRSLTQSEAIVAYHLNDGNDLAWIVRADRIRLVKLDLVANQVEKAILGLRRDLDPAKSDATVNVAAAHQLYRSLVAPLEAELAGVETIYLSPHGFLAWLPFAALVHEKPAAAEWRPSDPWRPAWLISRFDFAILPSVGLLPSLRRTTRAATPSARLLAGGDPEIVTPEDTGSRPRLRFQDGIANRAALGLYAPLPAAREEIEAAARTFGEAASRPVSGAEFNETWIKSAELKPYKYLLLATHAEAESPQSPAFLLMSRAENAEASSEGALTAAEIRSLDLDADLVILSACKTGRGLSQIGGYGELVSAFNEAGARNVIATHWQIASVAASPITIPLVEHLKEHGAVGLVPALNNIKRTLMRGSGKLRHPAYWGAYFLVGAPAERL